MVPGGKSKTLGKLSVLTVFPQFERSAHGVEVVEPPMLSSISGFLGGSLKKIGSSMRIG